MKERLNPITEEETRTKELPYKRDKWILVECMETGMVYLKNPPSYSQFIDELAWEKQFLQERARREAEEPILSSVSALIKTIRAHVRKRESIEIVSEKQIYELMKIRKTTDLTIVDVGCGTASALQKITREIHKKGKVKLHVVGIELSKVQSEEADANLKQVGGFCIHNTAIEGLKEIADNTVDLFILCSFLEHELYPLSLLKVCKAKLHSGGRMIIKVPNFNSVNRRVRQQRWCGFRYPDHVNYFKPETLKLVVSKAGLTVKEVNDFPLNDNMWMICLNQH